MKTLCVLILHILHVDDVKEFHELRCTVTEAFTLNSEKVTTKNTIIEM